MLISLSLLLAIQNRNSSSVVQTIYFYQKNAQKDWTRRQVQKPFIFNIMSQQETFTESDAPTVDFNTDLRVTATYS